MAFYGFLETQKIVDVVIWRGGGVGRGTRIGFGIAGRGW